jgi:hypothetical protein
MSTVSNGTCALHHHSYEVIATFPTELHRKVTAATPTGEIVATYTDDGFLTRMVDRAEVCFDIAVAVVFLADVGLIVSGAGSVVGFASAAQIVSSCMIRKSIYEEVLDNIDNSNFSTLPTKVAVGVASGAVTSKLWGLGDGVHLYNGINNALYDIADGISIQTGFPVNIYVATFAETLDSFLKRGVGSIKFGFTTGAALDIALEKILGITDDYISPILEYIKTGTRALESTDLYNQAEAAGQTGKELFISTVGYGYESVTGLFTYDYVAGAGGEVHEEL